MPVNAPMEYYKAEERFKSAKSKEEKIAALEEMIRLLPRHHGSENAHAQLTARLAKLKKESEKKGARHVGVKKEGDAQLCIIGLANSGKSTLLSKLTDAKPKISVTPYTTTKPEIGMMDYKGIKVQLVEIPSTFDPEYMSIARCADAIIVVANDDKEQKIIESVLENNYIRHKRIVIKASDEKNILKEKIWSMLGLMVVYTKKIVWKDSKGIKQFSPMALSTRATIKDFAVRIHKDFVTNFRFARITRGGRIIQAGLSYPLKDGDMVELHMK
ncbi:MAG TPA: TGS domain-containing protein [Candidatus Aenigmarchaeota archaeon]|nr:TGS domain-containing protein [Candidatus Aenigmarchaeota archaeon]